MEGGRAPALEAENVVFGVPALALPYQYYSLHCSLDETGRSKKAIAKVRVTKNYWQLIPVRHPLSFAATTRVQRLSFEYTIL